MHQTTAKIAQFWSNVQRYLFPCLEEEMGPLTQSHQEVARTLEMVRIEEYVPDTKGLPWRPAKDHAAIARAFVAKAVLNLATTRALLDRLAADPVLRRMCGWEQRHDVAGEWKFSRAFAGFAQTGLAGRVHEALIGTFQAQRLVGHISRDATAIEARERPVERAARCASAPKPKRKRGRPKKGEVVAAADPTRLERQQHMTLEQMLADLPTACDRGCKRNSKNSVEFWVGYKLHVDVADGHIPISAVLTSASTHDSQAALPLAVLTSGRVTSLYDLMDAAYDSTIIRQFSRGLGHVPLIDRNFKGDAEGKAERQAERQRLKRVGICLPEDERFKERTVIERVFSRLKDEFGGRCVRVRGPAKVLTHLMFGLLALTADHLMRLASG